MTDEHKHVWNLALHLNNCHAFGSTYGCDCGATRATVRERDFKEDPYSTIWMLEDCERCAELLAGADPIDFDKVYEKSEA